ncbi:hypothetical protein CC1G_15474 [Coprinopsis cinerea okayama7|uniref:Uncharacterized protein n=1 Tax=Coprinopsis cinerea (strain Okayama-7 / 130 / ATCC MYA-4618 / FGSC 9003) TaxID=240176 RepID=D6RQV8_COPC7|nr:hypothetical protein CC1G_15474 [Coprinopsis cinerea okayama7\|eukprot:XP_002910197.1 hypothetical protein CC1G_15474 [Coprinopsis cinerea okayama7\
MPRYSVVFDSDTLTPADPHWRTGGGSALPRVEESPSPDQRTHKEQKFKVTVPWRDIVESFPSAQKHPPVLTPYFMEVLLSRIPFPIDMSNSSFVQDTHFYGVSWRILPRPQLIPKEIVYGSPFIIQHHYIVRMPFSYNPATSRTWEPPIYIALRNRMEDDRYAFVELSPYDRTGTCLHPRYPNVILQVFKSFVNIAVDRTDADLTLMFTQPPQTHHGSSHLGGTIESAVDRLTLQQEQALFDDKAQDFAVHKNLHPKKLVDKATSTDKIIDLIRVERESDSEWEYEDEARGQCSTQQMTVAKGKLRRRGTVLGGSRHRR